MSYDLDTYSDVPYAIDNGVTNKVLFGMTGFTSGLLGIVTMLIVFFMTFVTIIDVLYISVPFFGELARKYNWDGTRDDRKIPFALISKDAVRAFEESYQSEASNGYKSKMLIYIRRRFLSFLKVAIILSLLNLGSGPILRIAYNIVEPMMRAFGLI